MADMVNHPLHYNSHPSGVECIDVIETLGFLVATAIKYLWRTEHKNGLEDLHKARWYVERELTRRRRDPRAVGYYTAESNEAYEKWRDHEPSGPRKTAISMLYTSIAYERNGLQVVSSAMNFVDALIAEETGDARHQA